MKHMLSVAGNEMRILIRDRRLVMIAVALTLLAIVSAAVGVASAKARAEEQQAILTGLRSQWESQGAKNAHDAAHFGMYALRPENAMSALDSGITPFAGSIIHMEPHRQNEAKFRPAQEEGAASRFGPLTFAYVFEALFPLLVILLAYRSIAGEREAGTLRLLLSSGISRSALVAGKALALWAAMIVAMIPASMVAILLIAYSGEAGDGARFAVILAAYLLYLSAILCASLSVSALSRTSRVALILLLFWWALGTFVMPRAAAALAQVIYPAATQADFQAAIDAEIDAAPPGLNGYQARQDAMTRRLLARYQVKRLEDVPINYASYGLVEDERFNSAIYTRHFDRMWHRLREQDRVQGYAGLLYPLAASRAVAMGMTGTDQARQIDFARQAEAFRQRYVFYLDEAVKPSRDGQPSVGDDALWRTVEDFRYRPPTPGSDTERVGWWLFSLVAWCAGAVALLALCTRRVRP